MGQELILAGEPEPEDSRLQRIEPVGALARCELSEVFIAMSGACRHRAGAALQKFKVCKHDDNQDKVTDSCASEKCPVLAAYVLKKQVLPGE